MRPFVKWAGGKTQLLGYIEAKYPKNIEKYCEPFVGGGAVLFDVLSKFNPKSVLINDINPFLINTYKVIKESPEELIEELEKLQDEYYSALSIEEKSEIYFKNRAEYNDIIKNGLDGVNIRAASLFITLNKTCFNGLYRVNSKGFFNVPFNKSAHPLICDKENLFCCHKLLKNTIIISADYKSCYDFVDETTFVYVDPPYRPLSATSSFVSYSNIDFLDSEQAELAEFLKQLSKKKANILLSNSDPKNVDTNDDFFDDLYCTFNIKRVFAGRAINSKASGRGKISELLISNY